MFFNCYQRTDLTLYEGYNHLCAGYLFALVAGLVLPRDNLLLVIGVNNSKRIGPRERSTPISL